MNTRDLRPRIALLAGSFAIACCGLLSAGETPRDASKDGESAPSEEEKRIEDLQQEKQVLALEQELEALRQQKKRAEEVLESKRLAFEAELRNLRAQAEAAPAEAAKAEAERTVALQMAEQKKELADLTLEKNRLDAEIALAQAKSQAELADLNAEKQELETRAALRQQKLESELAQIKAQTARIAAENARRSAELQKTDLAHRAERQKMEIEAARMDREMQRMALEERRLRHAKTQLRDQLTEMDLKLSLMRKKESLRELAENEPAYPAEPLRDAVLHVSDRRIDLDGVIMPGSGEYIEKRLHFYNSRSSSRPIFLVIGNSPGGSVMEGYRIIKAIDSSEAPVYVVVKSFAASMAAVIAGRAEHSVAYEHAILLHHQMWTFTWGNQTQIQEELDFMKEWQRRLFGPLAERAGVTMAEFVEKMYENSSDGDWREFGDKALANKWVTAVAGEVREHGHRRKPTGATPQPWWAGALEEKIDSHGARYIELPRLGPCDFYFLYNPDKYYR
jgi:ATP-dependent Clp protease protease subunit